MKVARNCCSLGLFGSPAEFARNYLGEFSDPNRMALCVLILAVDRSGKCLHRIVISRTHLVEQLAVFLGVALDLRHQVPLRYRYTDVSPHRADDLFLVVGIRLIRGLLTKKQCSYDLITNNQWNKKLEVSTFKAHVVNLKERKHL